MSCRSSEPFPPSFHRSVQDLPVLAIPLGFEIVVRNESKSGRIDAEAQATLVGRTVVEDMAEEHRWPTEPRF